MGKRKKTTRIAQNVAILDRTMARMVIGMKKGEEITINPKESALLVKILAYALRKMTEELKESDEENE